MEDVRNAIAELEAGAQELNLGIKLVGDAEAAALATVLATNRRGSSGRCCACFVGRHGIVCWRERRSSACPSQLPPRPVSALPQLPVSCALARRGLGTMCTTDTHSRRSFYQLSLSLSLSL
jgi:hypothetical protein